MFTEGVKVVNAYFLEKHREKVIMSFYLWVRGLWENFTFVSVYF